MSLTLKISNGQLDFDPATGQLNTVTDNRKAAQDLAECLLQDYLADIDYGSFLKSIATNNIPFSGDLFIRYYIADAVQKLMSKQQDDPNITSAEQILSINELSVNTDSDGTCVFFVGVTTGDGYVEKVAAQQTQLNHQYERF